MIKTFEIITATGAEEGYFYIRLKRDGDYFTQLTAIYTDENEAHEDANALLQWAES